MKAVLFHEVGGADKLRYEEVPSPRISPTDVLVQVGACGVNHIDIWIRTGAYKTTLPRILGTDVAGDVVEVGEAVTNVKEGDRAVIYPVLSCGRCAYCSTGRNNLCVTVNLLGFQVDGGYAEYVRVPADNVVLLPSELSYEIAAAVPVNFSTAWRALVTKAGIGPTDTVLVLGAGSGVGSAAIQIAKRFGAKVIATVGTDEKLAKAKRLGADEVVNHSIQDIAEAAKRFTGGRGVDVALDHVGAATWEKSLGSLAADGRLLTCGVTTGAQGAVNIRQVYRNELSIEGVYAFTKKDMFAVLGLVERGLVTPVLDMVLPLVKAAEAHRRMEERKHFGKIILTP